MTSRRCVAVQCLNAGRWLTLHIAYLRGLSANCWQTWHFWLNECGTHAGSEGVLDCLKQAVRQLKGMRLCNEAQEERMNVAPTERSIKEFEARLQSTVDNLRQHVAEQREALENVSNILGSELTVFCTCREVEVGPTQTPWTPPHSRIFDTAHSADRAGYRSVSPPE